MKRKNILFIPLIFLLLSVIFALSVWALYSVSKVEFKAFAEISEFEKLDEFAKEDLDSKEDEYLKNIAYSCCYTKLIEYKGKTYKIYAYVFNDTESSVEYFESCTGKNVSNAFNYSFSTNYLFSSRYVAFYNNCLYRIEGGGSADFIEALDYFNGDFKISEEDLNTN